MRPPDVIGTVPLVRCGFGSAVLLSIADILKLESIEKAYGGVVPRDQVALRMESHCRVSKLTMRTGRQGTKKHKSDVRGAFKVRARELLGHHAFSLAVLRHGLFEFSDLKQYAQLLASERSKDEGDTEPGGVKQPAR